MKVGKNNGNLVGDFSDRRSNDLESFDTLYAENSRVDLYKVETPEDLSGIPAHKTHTQAQDGWTNPPNFIEYVSESRQKPDFLNEALEEGMNAYLAVSEDAGIVGMGMLDVNELDSEEFDSEAEFKGLTVKTDYQGNGIGGALREKTYEDLEGIKEFNDVIAKTTTNHTTPFSMDIHAKNGLVPLAVIPQRYNNGHVANYDSVANIPNDHMTTTGNVYMASAKPEEVKVGDSRAAEILETLLDTDIEYETENTELEDIKWVYDLNTRHNRANLEASRERQDGFTFDQFGDESTDITLPEGNWMHELQVPLNDNGAQTAIEENFEDTFFPVGVWNSEGDWVLEYMSPRTDDNLMDEVVRGYENMPPIQGTQNQARIHLSPHKEFDSAVEAYEKVVGWANDNDRLPNDNELRLIEP